MQSRERHVTASDEPVFVTGLGAVSVWGWDAASLWQGLLSDQTGIGPPKRFNVQGHRTGIVGEAPPRPTSTRRQPVRRARAARADHFAESAAQEAVRAAGLSATDLGGPCGVFFGTSTAGMPEAEAYYRDATGPKPRAGRVGILRTHPLNNPGDAVARMLGVRGPVRSFSSACASGALAIAAALDALRSGEVELAIAGGSDALSQLTYAGFNALRVVDSQACRPFRQGRAGLSLGEGAGVIVLETEASATARGVPPLAILAGAGSSCDAHHMTAPHPRGNGAAWAMRHALADARMTPHRVDFINAHGTGTPHNDASEWRAIEQVFGDRAPRVWVTSTKASVGHLLGSSGAIEAVATVQCLHAETVHATAGEAPVDESMAVDLVTESPRRLPSPRPGTDGRPPNALSTSFGFGGANAALIFGGVPRRQRS